MTQYAPVGNTHIHRQLDSLGILGDYHLLLTHMIMGKRGSQAQDFWSKWISDGTSALDITMDNSVVELGDAMDFSKVIEAAKRVGAQHVVLPDVINDARGTADAGEEAMNEHAETLAEAGIAPLGIPQGLDVDELLECAKELVAVGVKRLGVTRYITEGSIGSRIDVTRALWKAHKLPMHLFGFSGNLLDDLTASRLPGVIGIDSAMPIWYGYAGHTLPDSPRKIDYGSRPPEYEHEDRDITHQARANVDRVREWLARV